MPRALRVCPTVGCPELTPGGRCPGCEAKAEAKRGTAAQRGYDHAHRTTFRRAVLTDQPICQCERSDCAHHGARCWSPSKHADHHPRDRRELERLGLNPHDPKYGRGLCARCHSKHTSHAQPGGWNAR